MTSDASGAWYVPEIELLGPKTAVSMTSDASGAWYVPAAP
jgi:hypothetical protein